MSCQNSPKCCKQKKIEQLESQLEEVTKQRDEAIALLADWVCRVSLVGGSWDDWDEGYKNAAYRPCGIRELLDIKIKQTEKQYTKEN
jgi:hypothetical protein